ncbi:MAG: glycosyltransferase [Burkholderiaceae bacterium]|nr:glycosyltransferase [Burkholderiaceae bacterium]
MNPSLPLVSIVLPTYKRAHVLPHAVRSVLAQTYANWELIVVDDNSPDDTAQVVKGFADPRIRYVKNDPNLRLPRALNRGFSLARGEVLTWTSDDNLYAPRAIEAMVARLSQGDCDLVYADYWLFSHDDAAGRPLDPQVDRLPDTVQLDRGNHMGACFLYTRQVYEAVGDYDPELFLVEDYDFFIRAAKQFRFAHLAEPLYYFRRDDDTLYLSRFAEVKASDVLVRHRNGLLDERGLVDAIVAILMRKPEGLKPALLRWSHSLVDGHSYRLARWQREWATATLRRRIGSEVARLLARQQHDGMAFKDTRDALTALMQRYGTIAY